jgi:hypothetical protein
MTYADSRTLVRTISQNVFVECAPSLETSRATGIICVGLKMPVSYTSVNCTKGKGIREQRGLSRLTVLMPQ